MKQTIPTIALALVSMITVVALILGIDSLTKFLLLGYLLASVGYWLVKAETQQRQLEELQRLRNAYAQLDQQAKLIIRTDLELHQTQEELDRKLASLIALHELGQRLRISLHPEEIYRQLNAQLITSFGFSKGLVGICESPEQLNWLSLIGVGEQTADQIRQQLRTSGWLQMMLANPTPRTLDAQSADPMARKLLELFTSHSVVVAGIKPHMGPAGCLLLAHEGLGTSERRGDEEFVAILVTQLVIAIENSALYEELWHSRQGLERKVKERTQELADANTELIRLNKAKSEFVSAVSHELRTPLAAIKGYAALLRSGQFGPLKAPQAERLAKVEKHADLLTQFINNLLDIARIESGRVNMERRPLDIHDFFNSILEVLRPQMDAKRIGLSVDVDGVTQLVGDPTHLPRVFVNLLSNAVKYTPEGGAIAITVQREGDRLVASVQDTGAGIDPSDLPKLFQEFYRGTNPINEQVRGTGLGLALVKSIVEAHQGQIGVQSALGKGTTFTVTLPVALPPAELGPQAS